MIEKLVIDFLRVCPNNFITEKEAIDPSVIGLQIFEDPIVGYADPMDLIFETYQNDPSITNGMFCPPCEWLPEGRTVISIFLPYTKAVKDGNSRNMKTPTAEWLHARYEGQLLIDDISKMIMREMINQGYRCVVPELDSRYKALIGTQMIKDKVLDNKDYGSNWSQRHVAYVAGLGTFGLSKGLITHKGIAGRFTSFVTDYVHKASVRDYKGIYDYCSFCGQCIDNCPTNAITLEGGKEHTPCSKYIDWTLKQFSPRYACGKCQVKVPCMDGIPNRD
jgi:epoxyqueuosine reductase QueG